MKVPYHKLILLALGVLLFAAACAGGSTPAPSTPTEPPATSTAVPPTATTAPTPTPPPTATTAPAPTSAAAASGPGDACVIGTWELSDMSAYMSSIMASVGQDSELKFDGQDGYVRYTFGADGKATIDANGFAVRFTLSMQGLAFEIAVTIDGTASSDYAVDSGKMTFSNVSGDDLKLSATLNGTDLFEGQSTNQLESLFGLSSAGPSTFAYQCDGNAMTYTPPIGNAEPVILKRVAP